LTVDKRQQQPRVEPSLKGAASLAILNYVKLGNIDHYFLGKETSQMHYTKPILNGTLWVEYRRVLIIFEHLVEEPPGGPVPCRCHSVRLFGNFERLMALAFGKVSTQARWLLEPLMASL